MTQIDNTNGKRKQRDIRGTSVLFFKPLWYIHSRHNPKYISVSIRADMLRKVKNSKNCAEHLGPLAIPPENQIRHEIPTNTPEMHRKNKSLWKLLLSNSGRTAKQSRIEHDNSTLSTPKVKYTPCQRFVEPMRNAKSPFPYSLLIFVHPSSRYVGKQVKVFSCIQSAAVRFTNLYGGVQSTVGTG